MLHSVIKIKASLLKLTEKIHTHMHSKLCSSEHLIMGKGEKECY